MMPGWEASPSQVTPPQFVTLSQQLAAIHLYSWVERDSARVNCLAQEHHTRFPGGVRTRTARSGDERANYEATVPLPA